MQNNTQLQKPKKQYCQLFDVTGKRQFDALYAALDSVACVSEEMHMQANDGNLRIRTMDPSHVCLIDMEFFTDHLYDDVKCAIRTDSLLKVLKSITWGAYDKDDTDGKRVVIAYIYDADHQNDKIRVRAGNDVTDLRVIAHCDSNVPEIKIDHTNKISVPAKDMLSAAKKIKAVSEYMSIGMQDGAVMAFGNGDDGKRSCQIDNTEVTRALEPEEKIVTVSMDYLYPILARAPKIIKDAQKDMDHRMELSTAVKKPIRLVYFNDWIRSEFWLAPRVED